jgi:hypothetical protein
MGMVPDRRVVARSLLISLIINFGMILLSVSGGLPGGRAAVWISDALAAPTGVVATLAFAPSQHSAKRIGMGHP